MATNPARADFNAQAALLKAAFEPFRRAVEPVLAEIGRKLSDVARRLDA